MKFTIYFILNHAIQGTSKEVQPSPRLHSQDIFILQKKTFVQLNNQFPFPFSLVSDSHWPALCLNKFACCGSYGILHSAAICVWLVSLSILFSRFIHSLSIYQHLTLLKALHGSTMWSSLVSWWTFSLFPLCYYEYGYENSHKLLSINLFLHT